MAGPTGKSAAGAKKGGKKAAEAAPQPEEAAAPPADDPQQLAAVPKKKRNNNPGIRVQGGRVYDSENGTTCHQCRQKTAETKAKCARCTLHFCPKCLENRYQERVEEVNARPGWSCPRCRGDCNCSNCRKKAGKEATGQLAGIAKKAGFGSVKDLLDKNPHAKALQLPKLPSAPSAAAAGAGGGASGGASGGFAGEPLQPRKRPSQKRKAAEEAAELELLADEELPEREQAMPEAQPLAALKSAGGGGAAGKRPRGGLAWVAGVPEATALPEGQAGAELVVVLEFLQVFGAKLQLRAPSLAAFAAELLQAPLEEGVGAPQLLCPSPDDSLVAAVHCRLLDVVRAYWNVKGAATPASWQGTMRGYYAASHLTHRQALGLRWQHGPPAVAGEIFTRPVRPEGAEEEEGEEEVVGGEGNGEVLLEEAELEAAVGAGGAAAAASAEYPPGGYWALPAAARVAMLHALVHDALECEELRNCIEESMGDALDEEKERRQQLAGVRKEARVAVARERDQQIALMIANASSGGLTLEQQQRMLEEARQRAEAAAHTAAAAKVRALTEKVHPPTVRAAVVGADRDGRRYLHLQAAPLFAREGGIVVQAAGPEGTCCGGAEAGGAGDSSQGAASEAFRCYSAASMAGVAAALHPRGRREGPLQAALVRAYKLPSPAAAEAAPQAAGGAGASSSDAELEQQAGSREQSAEVSVAGDCSEAAPAPAPAAGKLRAAAQRRKPSVAPASEPAPEASAEAAPEPAKRGRKPAAGRGKSTAAAAPKAAPEPAPAAAGGASKRRRQGGDADAGEGSAVAKRSKPSAGIKAAAAAAVAGKRGGRRASPRGAAGKAAGTTTRSRKAAAVQQLPLKVDDMLTA